MPIFLCAPADKQIKARITNEISVFFIGFYISIVVFVDRAKIE